MSSKTDDSKTRDGRAVAPVTAAAGAALVGVLAVHQLPVLPGAPWLVPLGLAALLALRRRAWYPVLWFVAAVIWTTGGAERRLEERLPADLLGRDFAVTGFVATFPALAPGQATFGFETVEPPAGVPRRLRLTWYDAPAGLAAGSHWDLTVRLRPPRGTRNPGGFDYERWLLVEGYGATGYVRAAAPDGALRPGLRAAWLTFRATLAARLERAAAGEGAPLLLALALGERQLFTEQHWSDFRRTGTSHLVAVSGMHVALLGLVAFALVRRFWLRLPAPLGRFDLEAAALMSVLATTYYAALTGFAVPAMRSLVMVAVGLAVLVSRRGVPAVQVLAAALLVALVWDPFAPLAVSFWLSFVAVAVLIALAAPRSCRPVDGRLRAVLARVRQFAAWQWAIALALLPLTVVWFGDVSLVGPLVNLVAIPLFNLVLVPLAVLATVAVSFTVFVDVASPGVYWVAELGRVVTDALHGIAGWPAAAWSVPTPPWPCIAIAALGVACAVGAPPGRARQLAWLALLPLFVPALPLLPEGTARAVVLDVGHGLAVLVETRRHRLLFDAGGASRSGFDVGAETVLPALAAGGRRGLDTLIVSHADSDHSGGAPAVVTAFPAAELLLGADVTKLAGRRCVRGQLWEWDGVRFEILHPVEGFATGNDGSCVLRVATQGSALLITGDIERRAESALQGTPLSAEVVVVPHHGSATSSTPPFVAAVGARHAIVSAGFANRWGFPRPEVRRRWEERGAAVAVTGADGAVTVMLGTNDARVTAERDGRHRYWYAP